MKFILIYQLELRRQGDTIHGLSARQINFGRFLKGFSIITQVIIE